MTNLEQPQGDRGPLSGVGKWLFLIMAGLPLLVSMIYLQFKPAPPKVPRHIPPPLVINPDAGTSAPGLSDVGQGAQ